MSIVRKGKETSEIHRFGKDSIEVWSFFKGVWTAVWLAIRSCFGRGFWANDKPWINTGGWKNM